MRERGMGHGWHGGRGPQRGQVAHLIEPCLLTLLRDGAGHGYDLIASLGRFGLDPDNLDNGMVYRSLRHMEVVGWVRSDWEIGTGGPPRRVYRLTDEGRQALSTWRDELRRTRDLVSRLLNALDGS